LPGGYVRQGFESTLLDLDGNLLTGLVVGRLQPFRPQGFELVVIRPAEPSGGAIGCQRQVGRWIERLDAGPAGAKDAPAAFIDRLLGRASYDQSAPVAGGNLDIEPEVLEAAIANSRRVIP
jgi:hypothetical protein